MAEISSNLNNNNELNIFKEEMLTHIRELEVKINNQISNKAFNLNKDYQEFTAQMNSLIKNNKEMVSDLVSQKLKIEKITELETFKNKVDGMLITHELRIKNNIDEISKMKLKYDKIVTDNLYVSGFIGNSCQFRNLSEYLSYNISEVSKLKMEREQYKKDMKEVKNKLDLAMKNMITLNNNSVKLCNTYTDNKQEEFRKLLEVAQGELNHKSMEMRAMIVQFHNETDLKMNDLKKEFNKLLEMKNEFNSYINEKYINYKKRHDELNLKTIKNDENIDINRKNLENAEKQINNLDKEIKELNFQIRNYYMVNNRLALLIEQLGVNPSKSEIAKLIFGIQANALNNESNKPLSFIQPQKSSKNVNILKMQLNQPQPFKFEQVKNAKNYKNIGNFTPQKNNLFNKISLIKKVNFKEEINIDSENSSNYLDETFKNNENKNSQKIKEKIKSNFNRNIKSNLKINYIKPSSKYSCKNINNKDISRDSKEHIKENDKENNKGNSLENNKNNIDNNIDNKENGKEDNINNNVNNNKENCIDNNKENIKNNNIKENTKENSFREYINNTVKNNIKEQKIIPRTILYSDNQKEKNSLINDKIQTLPLLTLGNKENNSEEIKKMNLSSSSFEKINIEKNKDLIMVLDKNNKINYYDKKNMKKIDIELEEDKKGCKFVALSLPPDPLKTPVINITRKKKVKNQGKYALVNNLINEYRAKLLSKAHSPEIKIDIENEIMDIPKKVTQAFGRTTYTFYFKKDINDFFNANRNINNFGYSKSKKSYKIKNHRRVDTGSFKSSKNNNI